MSASGTFEEPAEYLFKVLVVGDPGTGKTSFIKRYVHEVFSKDYKMTIGVDFALKVVNLDNHSLVRLQLWDIAGQERFGKMTRVFYKEAVAALVVYDVSRPATMDTARNWKADIDEKVQLSNGEPIPCMLLANKCDLPGTTSPDPEVMNRFCEENGFIGWYETSAKENVNVDASVRALIDRILEVTGSAQQAMQQRAAQQAAMDSSASSASRVNLAAPSEQKAEGGGCCG